MILNPNKAVPVVVDDGFVLWESRAIMQYLCNRYAPDSTLYPTDPKQRALVDRALNFDYGIAVHIGYFIGTKLIMNMEPAADKLAGLHASLKILDQLIGANRYLVGNQLTIADLSQLSLNAYLDIIGIDVTPYANYQRWLAGLRVELTYFNEINVIAPNDWHSLLDKLVNIRTDTPNHRPSSDPMNTTYSSNDIFNIYPYNIFYDVN
ncbi:unnamed protein product [Medioppia subpectinata]|uniref:Glutathione S-transferase n=1 Tax=Medioppia subpectinata TaxID=1979941 RepID=A0A7R9KDV9_9ACAR|nr:unnamed protein product [Medioppia subpectinata]CAG2101742.1 unnamed protein product [Medioppia subpectinata]